MTQGNRVDVFTNGVQFYPALIDAIRGALETVHLECYIFKAGRIAHRVIDALCDRARQGVRVRIVLDAVGSFGTYRRIRRPLVEAGCQVERYQRISWYRLARLNN